MKALSASILLVASFVSAAHAEEEAVSNAPAKRVTVAAAGIVAMPQADADDTTETSLGVGASLVYWINYNIGVVGSFDYVFANEKEDVVGEDVDIHFYSINLGARVTTKNREGLQPFGEVSLGRHTVGYDAPGSDDTQSDIGFRIGGGVTYRTGSGFALLGQLTYSTAEIENADIDGFLIDLGVAWDI